MNAKNMNTQNNASLEAKLQAHPSPVEMLRHAQVGGYDFPFPGQYTNWRDEQEAWQKSVVLFDQSFHMTDVYFEGPDVKRLLSGRTRPSNSWPATMMVM